MVRLVLAVSLATALAFVVSAACAGLGGAVLAVVSRIAAPTGFTVVLSLSLLAGVTRTAPAQANAAAV